MWTHGHFYWNELMTRDVAGAKAFYGETLGWSYEAMPMGEGMTYDVIQDGEKPVGGIFDIAKDDQGGMPEGWFAYIAVDDVEARLAKVEAAGGKILRPPFNVPEVGLIAIVQDRTGALIGWITPSEQN